MLNDWGIIVPMEVVAKDRVLDRSLDQKCRQVRFLKVIVDMFKLETLHQLQKEQQQVLCVHGNKRSNISLAAQFYTCCE